MNNANSREKIATPPFEVVVIQFAQWPKSPQAATAGPMAVRVALAMKMKVDDVQVAAEEFSDLLGTIHALTTFSFETARGPCDGSNIYISMPNGAPEMLAFDFERDTPVSRDQWTQELGAKLAKLFPIFRGVDDQEPIRWRAEHGEMQKTAMKQGILSIASALANQVCAELEAAELANAVQGARAETGQTRRGFESAHGGDAAIGHRRPKAL